MKKILDFEEEYIISSIIKSAEGIKKYNELMKLFKETNVYTDKDFRKKYNYFYKVRQKSSDFYNIYYDFLEKNKFNSKISFEEILKYFYINLNRFEASFSSKILATINPNFPIWDSFVLKNLGLKTLSLNSKNRFNEIVILYLDIIKWYDIALKDENINNYLKIFDSYYPNNGITNTKKLDFILWQLRN